MSGKLMLKGAHGVATNSLTVSPPRAPGHLSQAREGLGRHNSGGPEVPAYLPSPGPGVVCVPWYMTRVHGCKYKAWVKWRRLSPADTSSPG